MNILLLGSGGREHALAWKMAQSNLVKQLFIAPGNAGTATVGVNVALQLNDFEGIRDFCLDNLIDLVVVGPEDPLVAGIKDYFKTDPILQEIMFIGPSAEAAQLEGSKAFAKAFMQRHNIPTAAYREFTTDTIAEGREYISAHKMPVVLKADGLAAGKGVLICTTAEQALSEFDQMLLDKKFGVASSRVVIEEFLDGIELSVFALTDGKNYVLLPEAKDYKRIGEGDSGLNTGGMGAVSPVPFASKDFMEKVRERIIEPTINGLNKDNYDYTGFVFFGLIKVNGEPYVIEYNCRMGDPETEVVLPRLKDDLVELLQDAAEGKLQNHQLNFDKNAACTIMAVSGGYPGNYDKNKPIQGLNKPLAAGSLLFHAGTKQEDDQVLTNGGRVLCVTSLGPNIPAAVQQSLQQLAGIEFEGMNYRKDIGYEFN